MATTNRAGARLFYEDVGSGEPPIVFVHGLGTHEHFKPQIAHFACRHRIVAPDLPGYGQSDAPERHYTVEAFADDVAWLCDRLELRAPVIVGHSMGGAVALEVAAAHPALPSAVVMLDPIPIVAAPVFQERMSAFVAAIKGPDYREVLRGFAQARMFRPTDDPGLRARLVEDMCAVPQRVLAPAMASAMEWNGEAAATAVRVPVLLLSAGDDMPSDMARTREIVPSLEVGRTVGSGHFAHLMVPDQVNAMIERFLAVVSVAPAKV